MLDPELLETIHLSVLALTVITIVYADHQGFAYMTGRKQTLNKRSVTTAHVLVFIGLLGMITSGFFLALPGLSYYFSQPIFLLKMFFVVALFVNAVVISHLMHLATTTPFKELTKNQKAKLLLSGVVSTIGWLSAFTIGFFFL